MKLKITIDDKTITREVVKKEESIYGKYYKTQNGWCVDFDNHFNRWEITTIVKGEFMGRFKKTDIIEIK